jgi:hypothetical protein
MASAMRDQVTNPYEKVISALLLVEQTEKELSNG